MNRKIKTALATLLLACLALSCGPESSPEDSTLDSADQAMRLADSLASLEPVVDSVISCPDTVRLFIQLGNRSDTFELAHWQLMDKSPGLLVVAFANYPEPKDVLPTKPDQLRLKLSLYDLDSSRVGAGPGTYSYLYSEGKKVILDLYWGKSQGYLFGSQGDKEVCELELSETSDRLCGTITVDQAESQIAPRLRIEGAIRLPLGKPVNK